MKPTLKALARILPVYDRIFPQSVLEHLWKEAQPRNYPYKIKTTAVPFAILHAFIARVPSIVELLKAHGDVIGTHAKSTFADFLANPVFEKFVRLMLLHFQESTKASSPGPERLRPVDTMPLSLAATARSDASAINNNTIGIGLTWLLDLEPQSGCCPFEVLKIHSGAWNDAAFLMSEEARFPCDEQATDVFDRGFSSHRVMRERLARCEPFLMRLRKCEVKYWKCVKRVSRRKRHGSLKILHDMVATIGARTPVTVRLVWALLPNGEALIVATDRMDWTLEKILDGYRERWPIETMHKVIKDTIGLAHLYSFQESGLKALTQLALLLAGLVWVGLGEGEEKRSAEGKVLVVASIREGVTALRRRLIGTGTWKRNNTQRRYSKTRKRRKGKTRAKRPQTAGRNVSAPG